MSTADCVLSDSRGKERVSFTVDHHDYPLYSCILEDADIPETKYIFGVSHVGREQGSVVLASKYVLFRHSSGISQEARVGAGIDTIVEVLRRPDNKMIGSVDIDHHAR